MPSTRRQFLHGLTAAACASAVARLPAAAPGKKERPLGFSLYGMKSLPVLEAIDHCRRIGYDNIELPLMKGFATEPDKFSPSLRREIKDRLRSSGLELSSFLLHLDLSARDQAPARETIKTAGAIAANLADGPPLLFETVTGGKTEDWEATKEELAANLRAWAETAAAAHSRIAIKSHYGQVVNTPERLLWLYRKVNHPALTLTYDYSHYQAEGLELEHTLREVIPHTGFIHMKDVVVGQKPAKYLLVGEGQIDYVKYFRLLRELRYRGPILVEVSAQIHNQPGYQPVATAEKCYAFLSRALASSA